LDITSAKKKILISVLLGFAILAIVMMYSDIKGLEKAILSFDFRYIPGIILIVPMNYLSRYIKYSYYLNVIGVKAKLSDKVLILLSSFAMTITPAKLGEFIKCYMIKQKYNIPISTTAPLVVAERLTDGLGMIVLSFMGLATINYGVTLLIIVLSIIVFGIILVQNNSICLVIIEYFERFKFIRKHLDKIKNCYNSAYIVLKIKPLLFSIFIGMASWSCEGVVIYLTMTALGAEISLLQAIFVVSFSAVVGAISMLPGGLFAADGTMLGILVLMGFSNTVSGVATLISRFSTLWLGVIIGIISLLIAEKRGLLIKNNVSEEH